MAFEVFDDVAFYYAVVCILVVLLVPLSLFRLGRFLWSLTQPSKLTRQLEALPCKCKDCVQKLKTLQTKENNWKRFLTVANLLFVVGWIALIYLWVQLPAFQSQNLASFDPYALLEIDREATEDQIKKAWRTMSRKYHPDKNLDDPDAPQKFILLSKAYKILTDETTKANMERYGNVDGFQGVSVTIGLPSILTKKDNEVPILLIYFIIFIVAPPVLVFMWWRKARDLHETGVLKDTVGIYFKYVTENMSSKFLIEVLAASVEYKVLEERTANSKELKVLERDVKEHMVKQKFQRPYIVKASILIHAWLLNKPIPPALQEDMQLVLRECHKLLSVMLDVCLSRGFLRPALSVIELAQLMTQGMWVHDSQLKQLPLLEGEDIGKLSRKGMGTIEGLKSASEDKRRKAVPRLSEEEWKQIETIANVLPAVDLHHKYEVEDEKGLFEGDFMSLEITLERVPPEKFSTKKRSAQSSVTAGDDEDGDNEGRAARREARLALAASEEGDDEVKDLRPAAAANSEREDAVVGANNDVVLEDDEKLSEKEKLERVLMTKKKQKQDGEAPLVHATRFPFPKREKWTIVLLEMRKKGPNVISVHKTTTFNKVETFTLKFPVSPPDEDGKKNKNSYQLNYEVHAKCDSYVGCDQIHKFKVTVDRVTGEKKIKEAEVIDEEDVEEKEAEEEEKQPEGHWYYMGGSSIWELLLNVVIIAVFLFFAYNFLHSRGYWQKYCQPIINIASKWVSPIWKRVHAVIAPVYDPVMNFLGAVFAWISDKLNRPVDVEEIVRRRKANSEF